MKISNFMENLSKNLMEKKEVADSTAILYIKNLYKLNDKKEFNNFSFLKDYDAIMKKIEEYAENSKKLFLIAIVSSLSTEKDKPTYKKLYQKYYDTMINIAKEIKAGEHNEKTVKEENNWLSMELVQEKFNKLREEVDKFKNNKTITDDQYETLLKMMCLALFVMLPPRRNQDYQLVNVVKKYNDKMPSDINYLSYDDSEFIFNKYKTSKTYGQQRIKYNELKDIIDVYFKFHPLKKGKLTPKTNFRFLVYRNGDGFNQVNSLTRVLQKCFDGKHIGSSMLRHIYLSSKYDIKEMEDDAEAMAHSLNTQKEYLRKEQNINKVVV